MAARNQLLAAARKSPLLAQVRPERTRRHARSCTSTVDQAKANALGISIADINATLVGRVGWFVHQRLHRSRPRQARVHAGRRAVPNGAGRSRALVRAFVVPERWRRSRRSRTGAGSRVRRGSSATTAGPSTQHSGARLHPASAPVPRWTKWNGSSPTLPKGFGLEWTGASYQERLSGAQAPALYAISLLVVFLCLAALYESWAVPVAVMLVVPLGIIGAVLAATLRGLVNDIYFQVGLLATMGLAAKNAILIVEFAEAELRSGVDAVRSGVARLAVATAADPDDVVRIHRRRVSVGGGDWSGCCQPERHRHRCGRRHVHRA